MPDSSPSQPVKTHISLNAANIAKSTDFYRKLFNQEPRKQTVDYAKFELDEPPLVLSLVSHRAAQGGSLNHVGIRLSNSASLIEMQARLETVGISTRREDGVECCTSRQTKFWVTDPDRILWEIYILDDDHEAPSNPPTDSTADTRKSVWQHSIPNPFPARTPHEDNSLHEVILEGTFNLKTSSADADAILAEVYRVLRPGGEVRLHGLAGDKSFNRDPVSLPGPAAIVECVPIETEPMTAMTRAGFVQIRFEKLSPKPYFVVDNVQMREFLLVGFKPGHRPEKAAHQAIYLGPLSQVVDDFQNVFRRGERVQLNIHDWQSLSRSEVAGQFLLVAPENRAP